MKGLWVWTWLKCCFTSTETVGLLGTGIMEVIVYYTYRYTVTTSGGKRETIISIATLSPPVGEEGDYYTYRYTVTTSGGRGRLLYLSLHCHHQSDSCIKMGTDESHFNVSLTVRDKVTKTLSTDHNSRRERRAEGEIEPRSLCLPA